MLSQKGLLIIICFCKTVQSDHHANEPSEAERSHRHHSNYNREVRVTVGRTVMLPCEVPHAGNVTVSWFRRKDVRLLSVGSMTYTSDRRVRPLYDKQSEHWFLQITRVDEADSGYYECHVGTLPPRTALVKLDVKDPTANITSGKELHVHRGSPFNITCLVHWGDMPPSNVLWTAEEKNITLGLKDYVITTTSGNPVVSSLFVARATPEKAGKYHCRPEGFTAPYVMVHVLDGSHTGITIGISRKSMYVLSGK
ncbi:lachesin-like isoform X2 [Artemia franciscana]|uniref:lachesin-like isoform X2 n=1 Tax=Artemia franciscana TaxID=6661 RepID=UPI0032DB63F8